MSRSHLPRRLITTVTLVAAAMLPSIPRVICAQETPLQLTLTLADYRFTPANIEIRSGQTVALTLVNKDSITPHNLTLQDPQGKLDIDTNVAAGKSVTIKFTPKVAGTYTFYCNRKLSLMKSHRTRGMQGTLTVTQAGAD